MIGECAKNASARLESGKMMKDGEGENPIEGLRREDVRPVGRGEVGEGESQ